MNKPTNKKDDKPGFFKTITGALDDVMGEFKADIQAMTPPEPKQDLKKKREQEDEAKRLAELVSQSTSGLSENIVDDSPLPEPEEPEEFEEENHQVEGLKPPSKTLTTLPTGNLWHALKDPNATVRLHGDVAYHALTLADVKQYYEAVKMERAAPFTLGILAANLPALTEEEMDDETAGAADPDMLTASVLAALETEPRLFGAVGAGPRNLWSSIEALDDFLCTLLNDNTKLIALGPVGLDEPFAPYTLPQQKEQLARQLEIAADFKLPVLITNRKSHSQLKDALQAQKNLPPLVYLDPLLTPEDLDLVKAYNMYVVLRPEVTQPDFPGTGLYKQMPHSRLLLASGSALVAPHGFSGHFNQPRFLQNSITAAARFLGLKEYELLTVTNRNLASIFKL